jgi:FdhD protein
MNKIKSAGTIIQRFSNNCLLQVHDHLAIEEPLEIRLSYVEDERVIKKNISVTMRTPGSDDELSVGFLFTEGIIKSYEQVKELIIINNNSVEVNLHNNEKPFLQSAKRNFYTTSSCGVCGKTSIEAVSTVSVFGNAAGNISIEADIICKLPHLLRQQQPLFETTGGLHASALFDIYGNLVLLREDVGRHNALDKLIGASLFAGSLPLQSSVLLLSGRASFELIQKANMAGIRIVAAIGAPSSLAVQLAKDTGITLIGFLKSGSFNIYSGEKRIAIYETREA